MVLYITINGVSCCCSGGSPSHVLLAADLTILSNKACSDKYSDGAGKSYPTDRMMCAHDLTNGGKDSCQVLLFGCLMHFTHF